LLIALKVYLNYAATLNLTSPRLNTLASRLDTSRESFEPPKFKSDIGRALKVCDSNVEVKCTHFKSRY